MNVLVSVISFLIGAFIGLIISSCCVVANKNNIENGEE